MNRSQSLDILRGIAILLVLGYHANYYGIWARVGWAGVSLFFVLSGYLISGLLFTEYKERGSIGFARFFGRRAFKIWPSYYALLAATVWFYHVMHDVVPARPLTLAVTFLSNYFQGTSYELYPVGHIWSLCVEEQFYLALPLLLIILLRFGRSRSDPFRMIPVLSALSVVFCLFLRIIIIPQDGWTARTDLIFDALLVGVLLGYLHHFRRDWFDKLSATPWLLLSAALFAPMLFVERATRGVETLGLTAINISFFFFVAWSVRQTRLVPPFPGSRFVGKLLARIGFYSYSIYLWHMYLTPRVHHYPVTFLAFWTYVCASVCIGILMANLIEMPFLALRERILPKKKSAEISAPAVPDEQETPVLA